MSDPAQVRHSRLARLIARLYPARFRAEFGDEIAQFVDERLAERRAGARALLTLIVSLFAESLRESTRQRARALTAQLERRHSRRALPSATRPPAAGIRASVVIPYVSPPESLMDTALQDLRFTLRTLARRPAFTAVAVLTLMLGIGANTAIFSVVSAVLLRPLPFPHADRLVVIWGARGDEHEMGISVPNFEDLRTRNHTLEDMGITRSQSVNLTGGEKPDRLVGTFVTAGTLTVLGAHTVLGRLFTPKETALGTASRVAVISNEVWTTRFGSDRHMVGRTLVLNGRPHVVIGVLSAEYHDAFGPNDVWLPITSAPNPAWFTRGDQQVWGVGRLKPGVTVAEAQRDLSSIAKQLAAEYPTENAGLDADVTGLHDVLVGNVRPILVMLLAFVGLVLLIACANVANLQLARAASRARELALRVALGAGRSRLVRQLLTESLVLSIVGGVAGIAVAYWATQALIASMPSDLPVFGEIGLEPRVLAWAALITVLAALIFGAAPAIRVARSDPNDALKQRPGEGARGRGIDAQHTFVAVELALSVVLLVGAGLLTRSVLALQHVDPGFDPRNVLTAEFRLPAAKYKSPQEITQFMNRALAELRAVPGIRSAALVQGVPLSGNMDRSAYIPDSHPELTSATARPTQVNEVSDGFFGTMEIPLVEGRDFDSRDRAGAPRVAIVNRELARRAWPGQSAIGKRLQTVDEPGVWLTVVGVAGDVKQYTLGEPATPQVYAPMAQDPGIFASVVARTRGEPMALANALRSAIWSVDPDQPVWKIRSMDFLVTRDVAGARFTTLLSSSFALLALVLAAVGVYGVMSFAVVQRTREVGIRMALGAHERQVVSAMLGRGARVIAIALVLGGAAAFGAAHLLRHRLFGVTATDPITFVIAPLILALVALVACWLPARRAARVDPVVALRAE